MMLAGESARYALVRLLIAGVLALLAALTFILGILFVSQHYSEWISAARGSSTYTEEQKLNILAGLSGTTSLGEGAQKKMLKNLSGTQEVSEQRKMEILKSLQK